MKLIPILCCVRLLLSATEGYAYSIRLYQPSDFTGPPAELLARQPSVSKEELIVENFEKERLLDGIESNLAGGSKNSGGVGDDAPNPSAWDGNMASAAHNTPAFTFGIRGLRCVGVGVGDNDFGRESISLNGGAAVALNSLPNHAVNSGAKAYYLVITAEPGDPDIRAVSFSNGYTLVLDHLILSKNSSLGAGPPGNKLSASRVDQLNAMAERIAREFPGAKPGSAGERTFPEVTMNNPARLEAPAPPRQASPVEAMQQLAHSANSLDERMEAAWRLGLSSHPDPQVIRFLLKILGDNSEKVAIRRAAVNALGHLAITNAGAVEEIGQALEKVSPEISAISPNYQLLNGNFELVAGDGREGDLTGAFGEAMFGPGSPRLTGWSLFAGPVTLRNAHPSPAGGNLIELGPRTPPGAISQTIRTAPGQSYQLSFYTCSGRDFQCNRRLQVRAGALDQVIDSPIGSTYRLVKLEFRARSPWTSISVSALGDDGFGPLIDDIRVAPALQK